MRFLFRLKGMLDAVAGYTGDERTVPCEFIQNMTPNDPSRECDAMVMNE